MIRRLLTIFFSLFVCSFIIMGVVFVFVSNRGASNIGTIAQVDAPILITMSQIQSAASITQPTAAYIGRPSTTTPRRPTFALQVG